MMTSVHVIPTKRGMWRAVMMTDARYAWWSCAWSKWWNNKGNRLARSPEMWEQA